MIERHTVAHAIRDEVHKHSHAVLRIEAASRKIASDHHCHSDVLIRRAIVQRLKLQKQVAQF